MIPRVQRPLALPAAVVSIGQRDVANCARCSVPGAPVALRIATDGDGYSVEACDRCGLVRRIPRRAPGALVALPAVEAGSLAHVGIEPATLPRCRKDGCTQPRHSMKGRYCAEHAWDRKTWDRERKRRLATEARRLSA